MRGLIASAMDEKRDLCKELGDLGTLIWIWELVTSNGNGALLGNLILIKYKYNNG